MVPDIRKTHDMQKRVFWKYCKWIRYMSWYGGFRKFGYPEIIRNHPKSSCSTHFNQYVPIFLTIQLLGYHPFLIGNLLQCVMARWFSLTISCNLPRVVNAISPTALDPESCRAGSAAGDARWWLAGDELWNGQFLFRVADQKKLIKWFKLVLVTSLRAST